MKIRPIVVDECCPRKWADTLKSRGMLTLKLKKGMSDYTMKSVADIAGAYIVTCDKGFNDYENALYVQPETKSGSVYHMLDVLMRTEVE